MCRSRSKLLVVLLVLVCMVQLSIENEVNPQTYRLTTPTYYEGGGFTTDCTVAANMEGLRGCGPNTRLVNDNFGTVFERSLFIGWSSSLNNFTIEYDFGTPSVDITQIDIYFYHNPSGGYGLPDISYFYAFGDGFFIPLTITISDNSELSQTDNDIRMISLIVPPLGATFQFYRLVFKFSSYAINQTFISEIVSFTNTSPTIANDPIQFLSSNQSIQLGPSMLRSSLQLSCTVTNNGSFIWSWSGPAVDDSSTNRTQVLLADTSRTSILSISRISANDNGTYTCTAHYKNSALDLPPGTTPLYEAHSTSNNTAVILNSAVVTSFSPVIAPSGDNVTFNCTFTGYLPMDYQIVWRDSSGMYIDTNSTLVTILNDGGETQSGGPSIEGSVFTELSLSLIDDEDYDSYTCAIESTNIRGTVVLQAPPSSTAVVVRVSSSLQSSLTMSTTVTPPNPSVTTTVPLPLEAIGGIVAGGVLLIAILLIVSVIIILAVMRMRNSKSLRLTDREDSSNGIYEEPTKPTPPPLPYRPLVPDYATIDLSERFDTNGHAFQMKEMRKSPPISPQHYPEQPPTPAQISSKPDFLQANPMYASSENLERPKNEYLRPTRSLPFLESEEPNSEMGSQFNIYAKPSIVPPPIPPFRGTPDPEENYREDEDEYDHKRESGGEYTVEGFNPDIIKRQTLSSDGNHPYMADYNAIYNDPQPLQRSENMLLEVKEKNVRTLKELGMGQFGVVVLAHTVGLSLKQLSLSESNTDTGVSLVVAIKRLRSEADEKMREMFEKEVKFMARLKNENVVRLLGVCLSHNAFIMMEYMENGDLNHYLRDQELIEECYPLPENTLTVPVLIYICLQISQGMRYLASLRFIHRDLATRNILVGQDFKVKIADFGMSQNLYSDFYYRIQGRAILPIRWMANECFYGRFSEKTDVWSFGVLMWEVFTLCRQQPYENMSDQEVIDDAIKGSGRLLLVRPPPCPEEMYEVMLKCWINAPEERASFEDVYNMISSVHAYNELS